MPKKKGAHGKVNLEYGTPSRNFTPNKSGAKVAWERPARARGAKKGS